MGQMVEEVRDRALKLRMVPIGETFSRFTRLAHDLGRELGKDIELVLTGSETELDKSMVEKITDPLMHIVRTRSTMASSLPGRGASEASGPPAGSSSTPTTTRAAS